LLCILNTFLFVHFLQKCISGISFLCKLPTIFKPFVFHRADLRKRSYWLFSTGDAEKSTLWIIISQGAASPD
ncbi:MAG: hypothetical protein J6J86_04660, partial [Lachnospiraceae bacterium]|nr:hypothetical protein [Lachnospiraceae bacterium]